MRPPTFYGAMRPGSNGLCMMNLHHVVEQRFGWLWRVVGVPYKSNEFARQAADELRKEGHTVRVRPVLT